MATNEHEDETGDESGGDNDDGYKNTGDGGERAWDEGERGGGGGDDGGMDSEEGVEVGEGSICAPGSLRRGREGAEQSRGAGNRAVGVAEELAAGALVLLCAKPTLAPLEGGGAKRFKEGRRDEQGILEV